MGCERWLSVLPDETTPRRAHLQAGDPHMSRQIAIDQFVLDAAQTSMILDTVSRRDVPEFRAEAIHNGLRSYQDLLERRRSMTLADDEAPTLERMLDAIRAQLAFLE